MYLSLTAISPKGHSWDDGTMVYYSDFVWDNEDEEEYHYEYVGYTIYTCSVCGLTKMEQTPGVELIGKAGYGIYNASSFPASSSAMSENKKVADGIQSIGSYIIKKTTTELNIPTDSSSYDGVDFTAGCFVGVNGDFHYELSINLENDSDVTIYYCRYKQTSSKIYYGHVGVFDADVVAALEYESTDMSAFFSEHLVAEGELTSEESTPSILTINNLKAGKYYIYGYKNTNDSTEGGENSEESSEDNIGSIDTSDTTSRSCIFSIVVAEPQGDQEDDDSESQDNADQGNGIEPASLSSGITVISGIINKDGEPEALSVGSNIVVITGSDGDTEALEYEFVSEYNAYYYFGVAQYFDEMGNVYYFDPYVTIEYPGGAFVELDSEYTTNFYEDKGDEEGESNPEYLVYYGQTIGIYLNALEPGTYVFTIYASLTGYQGVGDHNIIEPQGHVDITYVEEDGTIVSSSNDGTYADPYAILINTPDTLSYEGSIEPEGTIYFEMASLLRNATVVVSVTEGIAIVAADGTELGQTASFYFELADSEDEVDYFKITSVEGGAFTITFTTTIPESGDESVNSEIIEAGNVYTYNIITEDVTVRGQTVSVSVEVEATMYITEAGEYTVTLLPYGEDYEGYENAYVSVLIGYSSDDLWGDIGPYEHTFAITEEDLAEEGGEIDVYFTMSAIDPIETTYNILVTYNEA